MDFFDIYHKYKNVYSNPIQVMWNSFRKKQFIPVILKDNSCMKWKREFVSAYVQTINISPERSEEIKQLFSLNQKSYDISTDHNGEFLKFDYKQYPLKFYGPQYKIGILTEVFAEDYNFLRPKGLAVMDIGGNIGDSAIYFAINGAKKIFALEPDSYLFNFALKNVKENNLEEKIEFLNAGYGQKMRHKTLKYNNEIKNFSMNDLVKKFSIENGILKMDCEGCEYNLLDEPINVLRKFKRVQIEFHYGFRNLERKLKESGFSVSHSKPIKSMGDESLLRKMALTNDDLTFGFLYAERI